MEGQQAKDWVLVNFLNFEKSLNGGASLPLHAKRKDAFEKYSRAGFPTVKDEEWRYTNPQPILDGGFSILNPKQQNPEVNAYEGLRIKNPEAYTVYCVDGVPVIPAELNGIPGLSVRPIGNDTVPCIGSVASVEDPLVSINTSFLNQGLVISVSRNTVIKQPIECIWIVTDNAANALVCPRVFVSLETGASCTVIEKFCAVSSQRYLTNSVFEVMVGENACFDHYRIQDECLDAYHLSTIAIKASSNAQVRTHTFSFGGKLVRNNVSIAMEGSGSDVTMNGLSALTGDQHVDNHTVLDHAKPHCESHELYKGIYGDRSQGVFSGTIIVQPDAQKTNAIQSNRSLLLTSRAQVNTKPQLKIWADDVKCTHGATVGQLDEDALFYIRSRGAKESDARLMLIHAFASEVISAVRIEAVRELLEGMLLGKLHLSE